MTSLLRLLCLLAVSSTSALSYSAEGHEIIADVAQDLIRGTPTEAKVKELLGSYTMAEVSTWADKIKGGNSPDTDLNAWRDANRDHPAGENSPRHNLHHYTNPAFQETSYSDGLKGTNPEDLVHAMRDCILILKGQEPSASFKGTSPKVALILLIHYAGDLAQPLHVGEGYLNQENVWVNPKESPTAWGTAGETVSHGGVQISTTVGIGRWWRVRRARLALRITRKSTHSSWRIRLLGLIFIDGRCPLTSKLGCRFSLAECCQKLGRHTRE